MARFTRRQFLATTAGAALGAAVAFATCRARRTRVAWRERRDVFPEGVASGDPTADSVILWTRRPFEGRDVAPLRFEVARDLEFHEVVAEGRASVSRASDWTCRALVAGLPPASVFFYRFTDEDGLGSRVGRTITAPADDDPRPVKFAFVSCQNPNLGAQNAYRRMIYEDERGSARLDFVLHLGDFIYELVWYPEDRPNGMYDRRVRELLRYASGEKIDDFHVPTTVDDYRAVYRAYLHDPDLQDARARWPFVSMWDNHEFSWLGWQGLQVFDGKTRPAQTKKVAANQAWFEYQPARVKKPTATLDVFDPPLVVDAPITHFDDDGLGDEPNNRLALASLTGYRALRFGSNVDLFVTDQHTYRSEDPTSGEAAKAFTAKDFPGLLPQEMMEIVDGGRAYGGGAPPATIRFDGKDLPNFRRESPPQTILGAEQKKWFKERLRASSATWKIWGNTQGTLDFRADPQNLPPGLTRPWPGAGYAGLPNGDHSTAYVERDEIYDFVRDERISGFATVAGDRHSFWAGLAAKALPPSAFEPIGVAFVTGSISAPGLVEAFEHKLPKTHPLRALFVVDRPGLTAAPTMNMLLLHGVRACLEYARTLDPARARAVSNPDLSPHLSFLDMGGHGYTTVTATPEALKVEFVAIPRPLERAPGADGGPLAYRVVHRARLWRPGERPSLEQRIVEGDASFAI